MSDLTSSYRGGVGARFRAFTVLAIAEFFPGSDLELSSNEPPSSIVTCRIEIRECIFAESMIAIEVESLL